MELKELKKFIFLDIVIFVLFVMLSAFTFLRVKDGIHFMLIWNMILAYIPLVIIYLLNILKERKGWPVILGLIWLFFYPNSLYLVTDLIYLDSDNYMQSLGMYQGLLYLQDIDAYLAFFHLVVAAFIGLMIAIRSFNYFYYLIVKKIPKYKYIFLLLIPFIASVGIYIGRFLRYNSWDVLNVYQVLIDFFKSLNWFSLIFILIFTILQYLIFGYILFYKSANKEVS